MKGCCYKSHCPRGQSLIYCCEGVGLSPVFSFRALPLPLWVKRVTWIKRCQKLAKVDELFLIFFYQFYYGVQWQFRVVYHRALNNTTRMNTKRKMSQEGGSYMSQKHTAQWKVISVGTPKSFTFSQSVTARMFLAQNIALSAITAVFILVAVIVADPWRGWWARWWSRRRRGGAIQI